MTPPECGRSNTKVQNRGAEGVDDLPKRAPERGLSIFTHDLLPGQSVFLAFVFGRNWMPFVFHNSHSTSERSPNVLPHSRADFPRRRSLTLQLGSHRNLCAQQS